MGFVVRSADFIGLADQLQRVVLAEVVLILSPFHPFFQIGADKDVENIVSIAKHIIGAAADEDAGPFFRKAADGRKLSVGNGFVDGLHQRRIPGVPAVTVLITGHAPPDAVRAFIVFFHKGLIEMKLFSAFIENGFIVTGDSEMIRDPMSDIGAAAAKLTADGNHFHIFHHSTSVFLFIIS